MEIALEFELEEDGRWLAEAAGLPGVIAYGQTRDEAAGAAMSLALRVVADRLEHGEITPDFTTISFAVRNEPVAVN